MKHLSALARGRHLAGLLLLLLLANAAAFAQAPAWQMALSAAPADYSPHYKVATTVTDAAGNVYLTGRFVGTARFGATTLTSAAGNPELFVAKWSPASNGFVWAQRAGGSSYNFVTAIAVSGSNVYIAGSVTGNATFGLPVSAAFADGGFIAKLADMGNRADFAWIERTDFGIAALAAAGTSLYATGSFYPTAHFGSITLTNAGQLGGSFVSRLTDTGPGVAYNWARQFGGPAEFNSWPTALAVQGAAVYVTGRFESASMTFGSTTLTNPNTTLGRNTADLYVAKLTDAGTSATFTWVQQAGGMAHEIPMDMAVSGSSIYLAGVFGTYSGSSSAMPANTPSTFGSTALVSTGEYDAFVAKLTDAGPAGRFEWAQRAGGVGNDSATAITVRGDQLYVAGTFLSPQAGFGSSTLGNVSTPNTFYSADIFVARLTDLGSSSRFDWAQQAGGPGRDFANGISSSGTSVYVSGGAGGDASFGSQAINPGLLSPLYVTSFLASLPDAGLVTAATSALRGTAFGLFPNPARVTTAVSLPAVPGAATATLTLLDALGRQVRTETVPLPAAGRRHELNLTGLAPGLYALRVRAGAETATRPLVVE
ncbi:T9SS type A sorting domain-containing protein [Hymenobacter ruricola]|uniref:T9SS type A sorting domain-containing protein n=1 Tax=Hymenobacter ruricola TaxID=2791023 RepID=A0ABS0I4H8_9BACT|nr:T9SS type A sorting domain-containing protein [Hymenobacter ruricola]MBF9221691.1 T9SS type A sorting domain-containing protein [Hymenobacter ruricola]